MNRNTFTASVFSLVVIAGVAFAAYSFARFTNEPDQSLVFNDGGVRLQISTNEGLGGVIKVNGLTAAMIPDASIMLHSAMRIEGGMLFLIELGSGGSACPSSFQIIFVPSQAPEGAFISSSFGNCSDVPSISNLYTSVQIAFTGQSPLQYELKNGTLFQKGSEKSVPIHPIPVPVLSGIGNVTCQSDDLRLKAYGAVQEKLMLTLGDDGAFIAKKQEPEYDTITDAPAEMSHARKQALVDMEAKAGVTLNPDDILVCQTQVGVVVIAVRNPVQPSSFGVIVGNFGLKSAASKDAGFLK
ncbi:MAG: hypothetical protein GC184_10610 [Rhizobiales bacterium]|nr:hypothetical protein [Hyphomicrobiales bacterium]